MAFHIPWAKPWLSGFAFQSNKGTRNHHIIGCLLWKNNLFEMFNFRFSGRNIVSGSHLSLAKPAWNLLPYSRVCLYVIICLAFLEGQWLAYHLYVRIPPSSVLAYFHSLPTFPSVASVSCSSSPDLLSLCAFSQLLLTEYSSFAWARHVSILPVPEDILLFILQTNRSPGQTSESLS